MVKKEAIGVIYSVLAQLHQIYTVHTTYRFLTDPIRLLVYQYSTAKLKL